MAEPEDIDAGDTKELAVTKVVTLRDLELNPSPPAEEWVMKCFKKTDSLQELPPKHEWELGDTSHVLMHIDIRNQQLYHLPLLITPIHCVYLVTFDLRNGKKALETIRRTMKQISAFVSNDAESSSKVLLVGTHGEEIVQEQSSDFVKELQSLKDRYKGLIEDPDDSEFWSIEGDSIDIQSGALFEEIISHCAYPKVPILQCMKYDKQLRQTCRGKTIVKSKLPDVSRKDVEKFLAFLHDYGFIVYHPYHELQDDDTSVVLDPQYLCQLFARVQQLRKKKGQEVTVERLFRSNAKLERSMKKWFETFCIRMGLVIVQPSSYGKKLVFVLSRQLQSEATSLAPHVYSVDPLLVAYNPQGTDGDSFVPPRFFPAFANTFLEILHDHQDCKNKLNVSINQSQAEIVIVWHVGCQIHVLEQESCIEIGFQLNAVNLDEQDMHSNFDERKKKFKKLQERCRTVKAVVAQSAKRAVEYLNLPGGDACIEYGFYHECNGDKVIGVHISDRHETALQCYCSCGQISCTPMQKIWFQDVTNCKVRLQHHEADGKILKLVEGTAPIQPSPQSQYTPGEKDSPQSDDAILSRNVYDHPRHLMLLRQYVSRRAADKGRAVLEGVGLDAPTIAACFTAHPLNEEGAVQEGLTKWFEGSSGFQPPTWGVLVKAIKFAQIDQQTVQGLKEELGQSAISLQSSNVTRTGTLQTSKQQKRVHAQQNPASCSKKRALSPQKAVSLQRSSVTRTGTLQTGKRQKRVHAQQNPASCSKKRALSPQKAGPS